MDVQGVATVKVQTNQYELEEEGTGITSYLTFEQVDAAAQKYMSGYKRPGYITKNVTTGNHRNTCKAKLCLCALYRWKL